MCPEDGKEKVELDTESIEILRVLDNERLRAARSRRQLMLRSTSLIEKWVEQEPHPLRISDYCDDIPVEPLTVRQRLEQLEEMGFVHHYHSFGRLHELLWLIMDAGAEWLAAYDARAEEAGA